MKRSNASWMALLICTAMVSACVSMPRLQARRMARLQARGATNPGVNMRMERQMSRMNNLKNRGPEIEEIEPTEKTALLFNTRDGQLSLRNSAELGFANRSRPQTAEMFAHNGKPSRGLSSDRRNH